MYNMIFNCLQMYQDVVQEDNDEVIQVVGKSIIHQLHKMCWGIRDSKGNTKELVQAPPNFERCLQNVFFLQRYLLIPRSNINAALDCGAPQTIKQLLRERKRTSVLDRLFVEPAVVDTKSKTAILLRCK